MRTSSKIKFALYAVIIAVAGLVIVVFIGYRQLREGDRNLLEIAPLKADISADRIDHTAVKDGVDQWRLKADSARLVQEKNETHFEKISVVFFLSDGRRVFLTADHGVLKTDSNNMRVTGNVVLTKDDMRMTTEALFYNNKHRLLRTRVPATITGPTFSISGDSLVYYLDTERLRISGNVESMLYGRQLL